ncbi:tetratricopeptide repeat protein 27, partial [Phenoliferia sp. Uapishka_3]
MSLSPVESALLHLSTPPPSASQIIKSACAATHEEALTSPFAKSVFRAAKDATGVRVGVVFPDADSDSSEEDLLALGVAALHAFAQVNWTGPSLPLSPLALFDQVEGGLTAEDLNEAAIDSLAYCGEPVYHLAHATVFLTLALQIFGLVPSPFAASPSLPSTSYSAQPCGHSWTLESVKIWRLRAGIVWIKVLDEPVPLPAYVPTDAAALRSALPTSSHDRPLLSMSLSMLASLLSRSSPHSSAQKEASTLAREAAKEDGLEWMLTGRMGKRTKWQIDEKTQLVVLARDRSVQAEKGKGKALEEALVEEESKGGEKGLVPEVLELNDDTLLERTAFTITDTPATEEFATSLSNLDPANQPTISPFSQSVLLALSLATLPQPTSLMNLHADVLSTSQVTSFVSRVLIDPKNWSVHSMALLLRCRAEAGRSRTVERGVLQMQALVDQLKDGSPTEISAISSAVKKEDMAEARDRLEQFHALALPPAWELERELATRYLSLGISKSALEIFQRLEMWEEVARCYVSLERPDRAIEVIRDLLDGGREESELVMDAKKGGNVFRGGDKRAAKLWCTLGELEVNEKHYEKAWIVSKKTSSRAQRSLGATYWAAGEWDKARVALRLALAINPLFPRTWFVLGCCEMRAEDWVGAQEAFGRCVALEDDDSESWSNLASCHLRRGEAEGDSDATEEDIEGGVDSTGVVASAPIEDDADAVIKLPFSRKRAAFHCLKQAIKHSYETWRIWVNYMIVAVDVGEMSEACRALGRIVEMRGEKQGEDAVDLEVLERLVDAVTRDQTDPDDPSSSASPYVDPNVGRGLAPRVERLITTIIYPRVSASPRVFLAHARLLIWHSDYAGALDAHLKAYRAGVASDTTVEHDREKFLDAAMHVEEVVGMLENLGPKDGKDGLPIAKDWKFQARSLVRTFLGRTKDAFEDEDAYEKLKELVKELK